MTLYMCSIEEIEDKMRNTSHLIALFALSDDSLSLVLLVTNRILVFETNVTLKL